MGEPGGRFSGAGKNGHGQIPVGLDVASRMGNPGIRKQRFRIKPKEVCRWSMYAHPM